jgi:branched-chain amino acid aminotransferase
MPTRLANIDGAITALERAAVSVLDRGFLYGDSVFETIRTYGGRPFALGRHLARLERSAALVHIPLPVPLEVLAGEVRDTVVHANNPESNIRVMLTRGTSELGLEPAQNPRPLRVIIVTPLKLPARETYDRGIATVTFRTLRAQDRTPAAGAKIGNYLVAVLAMDAARQAGASEALVLDAEERIVEGATSNVFFVRGGRLVTPPEDSGILSGITRSIVLEVAREAAIEVELRAPSVSELPGFDEVFVSSTIRELFPVVRVDGTPIGGATPGPVYRRLLEAFRRKAMEIQRLEDAPAGPYAPTIPPPIK